MKEYINDYLREYTRQEVYPWHMPGHKRQLPPWYDGQDKKNTEHMFQLDFTEAKGLDDLHAPESFIKKSLNEIAEVYGARESFMLVNGSTSGLMAAIFACCKRGDSILIARNCHKAVYNAITIRELIPYYIYPKLTEEGICMDITPEMLSNMLEQLAVRNIVPKAVVFTSPTYEGVISDIEGIAELLHEKNIPLIVDEAHGAHLEYMPEISSAVRQGADIVIESTHKTLAALTQTAVLHVNNEELTDQIRKYLGIFLSSSPSYIFMQSIERAIAYCDNHREVYQDYEKRLLRFRESCRDLQHIRLFQPEIRTAKGVYAYDECKLVFICENGERLSELLAEKGHYIEMTAFNYIVLMTSPADSEQAFDRLGRALHEIDAKYPDNNKEIVTGFSRCIEEAQCSNHRLHMPFEVCDRGIIYTDIIYACGCEASDYIYAYPPGIPIIVPGEIYSSDVLEEIKYKYGMGLKMIGIKYMDGHLQVPCI